MGPGVEYLVRGPVIVVHPVVFLRLRAECTGERDLRIGEDEAALRPGGLDVEDDELFQLAYASEGVERGAPVHSRCDFDVLQCGWVEEVHGVADSGAYGERGDVGHLAGEFWGDADEVVFAHGDDLDGVGVFEVGGVGVGVGGDDLLGRFGSGGALVSKSIQDGRKVKADVPSGYDIGEKLDHFQGVASLGVKEVQSISYFLDGYRVLLCVVLQDELFEVQERPLVGHFLSYLDERSPSVFSGKTRAVGTLTMLDEVLDLECLLEDGVGKHLEKDSQHEA